MHQQIVEEGKTAAIISYITIIGLLIAYFMNQNKRNPFTSFHIRQTLGIFLIGISITIIAKLTHLYFIGNLLSLGLFLLWLMGLINAARGEEKPVPIVGQQFQEWFKNIH